MEKAIIETSAGYIGLGWTVSGLVFLNLPASTLHDAEMEVNAAADSLGATKGTAKGSQVNQFDFKKIECELKSFFDGKTVSLSFPVDWAYHTDFQRKVLQRVCLIPWGKVVSYGEIAAAIGNPRGARAVGGAVGSNRVLLVVPCHRVIAHNGKIGGFGSGLQWKRKLLKLEGIYIG
ncbi:MAG: methylated-DNA--[protein]-cysteine S-methyltransferase [Bacillota bacterium]